MRPGSLGEITDACPLVLSDSDLPLVATQKSFNHLALSPPYVSHKGRLAVITALVLLCSLVLGSLPAVLRNMVTSVLPDLPLSSAVTLSLYYSLFVFLGSFLFQRKRCPTYFQKSISQFPFLNISAPTACGTCIEPFVSQHHLKYVFPSSSFFPHLHPCFLIQKSF